MRRAARAKQIIESIAPPVEIVEQADNIQQPEEDFGSVPLPETEGAVEEPEPLNEDEQAEIKVFKRKLTAYKKSYPNRFNDLNWSALEGDNIEELEELYNDVQLTLNHGYQKSAGMIGVAYQTSIRALEGAATMTNGLVLLDGLSVATAKNEEIRDILTQINIESGCYDSVQLPELRLAVATLNTAFQVHMFNNQLKNNPQLLDQIKQQQGQPVKEMREQYSDL